MNKANLRPTACRITSLMGQCGKCGWKMEPCAACLTVLVELERLAVALRCEHKFAHDGVCEYCGNRREP